MCKVYDESWADLNEVIVYGLGFVGSRYIDLFQKQFQIRFIVDKATSQEVFHDIPVISKDEMLLKRNGEKIIVFASRDAYQSIRKDLMENGLSEGIDFCKFDDFIKNWFWQFEGKNCLREVHSAINTNCTLKCKKCNMFVPYYDRIYKYSLADIKQDFALFFDRIDYVYFFSFVGGEPLLNEDLPFMIEHLGEHYKDKIGRIEIITNGSVIPANSTIQMVKDYNVVIRISNYSSVVPYKNKLEQLCKILDEWSILYRVEDSLQWNDFCFPNSGNRIKIENIRQHMLCCAPEFHGLNDGRFYYCHVAWSAEKAGLIRLKEEDYIDLKEIDSTSILECRKIVEHAHGNVKTGYISLCEVCMGCGDDNNLFVPAGEQWKK